MAEIISATTAFSSKWKEAEDEIKKALEGEKKVKFFSEGLADTYSDAIEELDVDDDHSSLEKKWQQESGIEVGKWSPIRLQVYHGLMLQKALDFRYKNSIGKNTKATYDAAAKAMEESVKQMESFKELIKFDA